MSKDDDYDFEPKTIVEAYLQQEISRLREALEIECSGSYNVEEALHPNQADEIKELKHRVENRAKQWAEQHIQIKSQAATIAQLQLDNAKLREALLHIQNIVIGDRYNRWDEAHVVINIRGLISDYCNNVLSTTSQPESQPESVVLNNRTTQKPTVLNSRD